MKTSKLLLVISAGLLLASASSAAPPSKAVNPARRTPQLAPVAATSECGHMLRPWTANKAHHFVRCENEKQRGGAMGAYCQRHCA